MRKVTLALGLGAALLTSTVASAQSNTTIGVGTGAVAGAVVGGPVGAVVGGVAGGFVGASTERRRYRAARKGHAADRVRRRR